MQTSVVITVNVGTMNQAIGTWVDIKKERERMIKGDSSEYDLLEKWSSLNCDGYKTLEIGVREGLGSKIIMDNAENYMMHIGIDPYANLKYQHYDNHEPLTYDYTDDMRDRMI